MSALNDYDYRDEIGMLMNFMTNRIMHRNERSVLIVIIMIKRECS